MPELSNDFDSIDRLFHPRAVAVVGVSDSPGNQGRFLIEAIKCCGFKGDVYAVNPREGIKSWVTYPKVSDIPGPVDHLIISVPAKYVSEVIRDAGKKGVRSASMFSSGFGESGTKEGQQLEDELKKAGREAGVRLIGPNCMGFYCPSTGLSFRPDLTMVDGPIGFISQSGGVCITGIFMGADRGLGFSKAVSYGNETDLGAPEMLDYLSKDPATKVILLYIEGTRRGCDLMMALKNATAKKPVFVLKGGVSGAGLRAVSSHTGALAGAGTIWEKMISQSGAIPVNDLDELVDAAQATLFLKPVKGKRIGLLTISGGFGVFSTDLMERAGFDIPEFSPNAKEALGQIFKWPGTSVRNPLDMAGAFFQPKKYPSIVQALNSDDNMDAYIMLLAIDYLTFRGEGGETWAVKITELLLRAFKELTKPVAFVFFQTGMNKARIDLEKIIVKEGYPLYPTVGRAALALDRMMRVVKA